MSEQERLLEQARSVAASLEAENAQLRLALHKMVAVWMVSTDFVKEILALLEDES